jgi:hypothetical protein
MIYSLYFEIFQLVGLRHILCRDSIITIYKNIKIYFGMITSMVNGDAQKECHNLERFIQLIQAIPVTEQFDSYKALQGLLQPCHSLEFGRFICNWEVLSSTILVLFANEI